MKTSVYCEKRELLTIAIRSKLTSQIQKNQLYRYFSPILSFQCPPLHPIAFTFKTRLKKKLIIKMLAARTLVNRSINRFSSPPHHFSHFPDTHQNWLPPIRLILEKPQGKILALPWAHSNYVKRLFHGDQYQGIHSTHGIDLI